MRKLMFLVVLSIVAAGQVKADSACVAGTFASYQALTSCNIGGVLDFSLFGIAQGGVFPSGPGTSPFNTPRRF